jgi:precorrin-6Y C5,15-methyltransferase (decarboxylating)
MSEACAPRWLSILGIGEDGVEGLSPAARALLSGAEHVFGGARHLALAGGLISGARTRWPRPIGAALPQILARRPGRVAVLASGDPFCHGIGGLLAPLVSCDEMICLPAPSAFALARARLGWSSQDVSTLSLCGREVATLMPLLQPGRRLLVLSADATTPGLVASLLRARGFGSSPVLLMEALGGPSERVRPLGEMPPNDINALNLLAIELRAGPDAMVLPLTAGLPDDAFEHDGQLTKREVRAVTLAALAPTRGGVLWDIGSGSGSIGIEWMLRDPANRAIGIEPRPDRVARAARNAMALGVPDYRIERGTAPEAVAGLPTPDAVFIGGGARAEVIDAAWNALPPGGRLVVNAVTLETEMLLCAAQHRLGGELTRVSVDRLDRIGAMRVFRPAMTVTQWSVVKPWPQA